MNQIQQLPPIQRVPAWYQQIEPYMLISPDIVAKLHSDMVHLEKFGIVIPKKLVPNFKDVNAIYNYMLGAIKQINEFENYRQQQNQRNKI